MVFSQGNRKVEYVYNYLGGRAKKEEYEGNTLNWNSRFAYMGYLIVASMDCTQHTFNPALLGIWFWDLLEPVTPRVLAMCTHNADKGVETVHCVTHDLLKSVSALFDSPGTRQGKFEYMPYGETLTAQGAWAASMPFRYSSEYRDEDLGLIYYNYRHYNPIDGRWISRDPIGEEGGEYLYGFVKNNSVSVNDYLGLSFNSREERYGDGCILSQDSSDIQVIPEYAGTRKPEREVRKVSEAVIDKYTRYPKAVKTAVTGLDAFGIAVSTTASPFLLSMQIHVIVEFTCKCQCGSCLFGGSKSSMIGEFTINGRSFGNKNTIDGLGGVNKVPENWRIEEKKQEEFNKLFSAKLKECEKKCKLK